MARMNWKSGFALLLAAGLLPGCAAWRPEPEVVSAPATIAEEALREPAGAKQHAADPSAPADSVAEINKIIAETNQQLSENGGEHDQVPLQIPVEINRKVEQWIKFFTERQHDMTTRYLERGEPLRPHIEAILKENEVPADLYYLAMIESGFVSQAHSRAKAVGIWQFVKGTGKNYKMQINASVDERRNWIKATEAAANYLKDLHNVFGSWYLALAAYNSGEYKIVRSIMKGKTRDFWVLAERGLLPQETMDYVPKFLAAELVAKNYKRLGFTLTLKPEDEWADWETVSVPSGIKLTELAKKTTVSIDVLKRWNRDLVKGVTPFSQTGSVDIYLPKTEVAKVDAAKDEVAKLTQHLSKKERMRIARGGEDNYGYYVVRRGDNLGSISRHIGISTRTLMKINGLRRGRIHPGQRLKFYGNGATAEDDSDDSPKKKKKRGPASKKKTQ
jgi:membrane-bound lytic murein transglycosylase D